MPERGARLTVAIKRPETHIVSPVDGRVKGWQKDHWGEELDVDVRLDAASPDKPVGAICHGPWVLVEADVVRGRRTTSYHTIRTDLRNAGADWVDEEVVLDQGLVTSRNPDDIPPFNRKMVEEIAEGRH